jgi:hypothetical protein
LLIVLLSTALAEAREVSTGPLRVDDGDNVVCIAANVGAANIANVALTIKFRRLDGTSTGHQEWSCGTLAPSETCQGDINSGLRSYATFCEITYPGGRIRGTLCNTTLGLCSDAR